MFVGLVSSPYLCRTKQVACWTFSSMSLRPFRAGLHTEAAYFMTALTRYYMPVLWRFEGLSWCSAWWIPELICLLLPLLFTCLCNVRFTGNMNPKICGSIHLCAFDGIVLWYWLFFPWNVIEVTLWGVETHSPGFLQAFQSPGLLVVEYRLWQCALLCRWCCHLQKGYIWKSWTQACQLWMMEIRLDPGLIPIELQMLQEQRLKSHYQSLLAAFDLLGSLQSISGSFHQCCKISVFSEDTDLIPRWKL